MDSLASDRGRRFADPRFVIRRLARFAPIALLGVVGAIVCVLAVDVTSGQSEESVRSVGVPSPQRAVVESVVAGDRWIHLELSVPASSSSRHTLVARPSRGPERRSTIEAQDGAETTSHLRVRRRLEDLTNDEEISFWIESERDDGPDLRSETRSATPRPVLYVDPAAEERALPDGAVRDGSTPKLAFPRLERAIAASIASAGVNIHVAAGDLPDRRVFLFDGTMVYGGFDSSFDPAKRRPGSTRLRAIAGKDLVVIAPGEAPSGMDGFTLRGEGVGRRGVLADDARVRLCDLTVRDFVEKGIELRGGDGRDEGLSAEIHGVEVRDCGGEGLAVEGIVDVIVNRSRFTGNEQEGIDASELLVRRGRSCRLRLVACEVRQNRDVGVDITLGRHERSRKGRFDVVVERCTIESNDDLGLGYDLEIPRSEEVEVSLRVFECTFDGNGKSGLLVNTDAPGRFDLRSLRAIGNRGSGIELTGRARDAIVHLRSVESRGNERAALELDTRSSVWLHGGRMAATRGAAIVGDAPWLRLDGAQVSNGEAASGEMSDSAMAEAYVAVRNDAKRTSADRIPVRLQPAPGSLIDAWSWTLEFASGAFEAGPAHARAIAGGRTVALDVDLDPTTGRLIISGSAPLPAGPVELHVGIGEPEAKNALQIDYFAAPATADSTASASAPLTMRVQLESDARDRRRTIVLPAGEHRFEVRRNVDKSPVSIELLDPSTSEAIDRRRLERGIEEVTIGPVAGGRSVEVRIRADSGDFAPQRCEVRIGPWRVPTSVDREGR